MGVCTGIVEYIWSTWETVLVRQSTTGERGRCADTEDCYRGTGAAVLVQDSFIGALGSPCGTVEYYRRTGGNAGKEEYYGRTGGGYYTGTALQVFM